MSDMIADIKNVTIYRGGCDLQSPLSFQWNTGQTICITGATGSGKTTFLKLLAGITFSSKAEITYPLLEELKKSSERQLFISDLIAFVSQEIKIPVRYIEDMYYQRRFQSTEQEGLPTTYDILMDLANNDVEKVKWASEQMNLSELLEQPFLQLSNGQTRRLMIAIGLLKQPKILILDNPYTGLDTQARISLNKHLKKLLDEGIHLFMAAHEQELENLDFITHTIRLAPVQTPSSEKKQLPSFLKSFTPSDTSEIIHVSTLEIRYGKKIILDIPSWTVNPLDRWIIKGKNGSGKSTLLSVIMADHPQAYSNEVWMFGTRRGDGDNIWDVKKRIGYFSPELLRYFELQQTGEYIIASGKSDFTGHSSPLSLQNKIEITELANWLEISFLLSLNFGDMSLGQQKMILIARAMFKNSELIILDEPLQGMDTAWREHFKKKIDEFSQNRTILYVTHDDEEIPPGNWQTLQL